MKSLKCKNCSYKFELTEKDQQEIKEGNGEALLFCKMCREDQQPNKPIFNGVITTGDVFIPFEKIVRANLKTMNIWDTLGNLHGIDIGNMGHYLSYYKVK